VASGEDERLSLYPHEDAQHRARRWKSVGCAPTIVGGAVTRKWGGAAGAWGQCAPASPVPRGRPAPQLHRYASFTANLINHAPLGIYRDQDLGTGPELRFPCGVASYNERDKDFPVPFVETTISYAIFRLLAARRRQCDACCVLLSDSMRRGLAETHAC
jgi:hypothetical protein